MHLSCCQLMDIDGRFDCTKATQLRPVIEHVEGLFRGRKWTDLVIVPARSFKDPSGDKTVVDRVTTFTDPVTRKSQDIHHLALPVAGRKQLNFVDLADSNLHPASDVVKFYVNGQLFQCDSEAKLFETNRRLLQEHLGGTWWGTGDVDKNLRRALRLFVLALLERPEREAVAHVLGQLEHFQDTPCGEVFQWKMSGRSGPGLFSKLEQVLCDYFNANVMTDEAKCFMLEFHAGACEVAGVLTA